MNNSAFKKLKILFFILFSLTLVSWKGINSFSKFKETYGGEGYDAAHSILHLKQTDEYIVGGITSSHSNDGNIDGNILKINKSGRVLWSKTLGGKGSEEVNHVIETPDDKLIIIGYTDSDNINQSSEEIINQTSLNKVWVSKMDLSGNVIWSNTYSKIGVIFQAFNGIVTEEGNILIIGSSISLTGDDINSEIYLLNIDKNGKKVWEKFYNVYHSQEGIDVVEANGGYTIVANIEENYKWNIWLFHINKQGTVVWNNTFGGRDNEKSNKLIKTKDGGYAIGGYTYSFAKGSLDAWFIRVDKKGNEEWSKVFGGLSTDEIYSIVETKQQGFMAVGYSEPWQSNEDGENILTSGIDLFIVHLDKKGNIVWEKTWGGEGEQRAIDIVGNNNGFSLVGFTNTGNDKGIDMLIMNNGQGNDFSF